jgi:O-antigen/teichoic acid export membrane protein
MQIKADNKKIASNTIFLSIRMIVVMLITLFSTRFILNALGVSDYGIYNVVFGVVMMCSFLTPAMANGIQRYYNVELAKNGQFGAKKVFNHGFLLQVILALVILIICETIGLWYINNCLVIDCTRLFAAKIVYQLATSSLIVSVIQVPFVAAIMAHEKMGFFAFQNIVDAILKLVISIALIYIDADHLVVYGLLLLGVNILDLLLCGVYSRVKFNEVRFEFRYENKLLKSMLSFSGWNLFEKFARIAKDQGLNMILNLFFGPLVNAARGITNQITNAFTGLLDSSITAARPQAIQAYALGNKTRTIKIVSSLSKFSLYLVLILGIPVFLEIQSILEIWLGNNYPIYTIGFVRISILYLLIDKLSAPLSVAVHASGKMMAYNLSAGIVNIIALPISYFYLYISNDPYGVFFILLGCACLSILIFLFILKNIMDFPIRYYIQNVILKFSFVAILSIIAPILIHLNMSIGVLKIFIVALAGLLSSIIFCYILGLSSDEKKLVKNFLIPYLKLKK